MGERTAKFWSRAWAKWGKEFVWDAAERKLVMYSVGPRLPYSNVPNQPPVGTRMSKEDAELEVLRRTFSVVKERVKTMLDGTEDAKRRLATRLAVEVADFLPDGDDLTGNATYNAAKSLGLENSATDMVFQSRAPESLDKLAWFALTWKAYKHQWSLVPADCKAFLKALRVFGRTLGSAGCCRANIKDSDASTIGTAPMSVPPAAGSRTAADEGASPSP